MRQNTVRMNRIAVARRPSEERYRSLVETSVDGIVLLDLEGSILMANRRAVDLCGSAGSGAPVGLSVAVSPRE